MKTEEIKDLFNKFESIVCDYNGVECWSARELCNLLGYVQWRNFLTIVGKAKSACENAGMKVEDHFADVSKMVSLGSGSEREIDNMMLTRYACYLIAQNGDSRKPRMSRRLSAAWQRETKTLKRIITSDKRYTPVVMTVVVFHNM